MENARSDSVTPARSVDREDAVPASDGMFVGIVWLLCYLLLGGGGLLFFVASS